MREGSLDAPTRHSLKWQDPDFYDPQKLDDELRRVFDICHGCRRCFNLCDSFPRLFDLVDNSQTGELDSVKSEDFKPVIDACTLCDMCFMTKCPYVPPHEFNLDFPHLILRARAAEQRAGKFNFFQTQLGQTDRNGALAGAVAPLANWATRTGNRLTRLIMEGVAGIHRDAALPKFHSKTFLRSAKDAPPTVNREAPAAGRKAVLYATCFVNYNNPDIGIAAQAILAKNGVITEVLYPTCCGMPQFEQGHLSDVAAKARKVAAELGTWIDRGYDVVALVPSCALMIKFEWPLIVTDDPAVKKLSDATFDVTEYVVDIAKKEGLSPGLTPLPGKVVVHLACHARAQNMGAKAADMMKLVPNTAVDVIERCSGHGGSWGVLKDNFEVGFKVGAPVARKAVESEAQFVASECPLAGEHIVQGMQRLDQGSAHDRAYHPIELFAKAYGLAP
ncbi:MAG: glycerol-3-phosphate dehydrogenase [Alphaproteobacteria bacterium]|nr:glycerol-3-phosphate dehydrogenase [Alphaproteobacteria bacterium]